MLTRQQRRQLERNKSKAIPNITNLANMTSQESYIKTRMYTYDEALKLAIAFRNESIKVTQERYDKFYTYAQVCALNAEPFKFGRKRLKAFFELFYDQLEALKIGTVDLEIMEQTANSLGIKLQHTDAGLEIDIDEGKNKPSKIKII